MKERVARVLKSAGIEEKNLLEMIEVPKNPEMGDYAFPCFGSAKKLKKNPGDIAKDLSIKIKPGSTFEKVIAVGPYVNFFVDRKKLASEVIGKVSKEGKKYGEANIKEKLVIEFPSPNTNKPLHLGHARNIILGQAIGRISEFMGNNVKIVNLNNDRGIHICKSMVAYEKYGGTSTPESANRKSDHFVGDYYVKYAQKSKANPKLENDAVECLKKWEKGDKKTVALWKKMNKWALSGFEKTYKDFDLKFDREYFESDVYSSGKKIISDSLKKGKVKKKKDGAFFIDLKKEGLGEKILLRADGTSIYITQDLYLAITRQKEYNFDKMMYVVATEQNYHFDTLFSILKKLGYKWSDKLYHLNYGMVHLESGRMKSREGTVVDIDDLVDGLKKIATKEIEKRYDDLFADEVSDRAFAISMAALRYYLLKVERLRDITFKPKESLSFDGDTGPYLLYSYARAQGILDKASYKKQKKLEIKEVDDYERKLLLEISKFPEIVEHSYRNLAPNSIANYSYSLAKTFSEFYHNAQVINSENEQFRLKIVDSFSQTIKNALWLLGIPVIREM